MGKWTPYRIRYTKDSVTITHLENPWADGALCSKNTHLTRDLIIIDTSGYRYIDFRHVSTCHCVQGGLDFDLRQTYVRLRAAPKIPEQYE